MSSGKLLTKSRFKLGCECITKLYFTGNKEYGNSKNDDSFLKSLAEGGFQVGELAKLYFENGHEVETLDYELAVAETEKLLQQTNVVIYEAAFHFESLFVRVDILRKTGSDVQLIEVKAKSINTEENSFYKKKSRALDSEWEPYLLDVAFQTHVASKSHPELKFKPFLMLADKQSTASVDGLNQNFLLETNNGRSRARTRERLSGSKLGTQILKQIDVSSEVAFINHEYKLGNKKFLELIEHYSDTYSRGQQVFEGVGSKCKSCEFRISNDLKADGLKSGFEECWKVQLKLKDSDFQRPFAFEIWNSRKTDDFLSENIVFMDQVSREDLLPKTQGKESEGLNTSERQWLQVEKVLNNDNTAYLDEAGLKNVFSSFIYPLNFIDFETTMVAIPFTKGRRPYEQIAFQFSHHILNKDGSIEHKTEYINRKRGNFPNFDFVRALKSALEKNNGTIFRFAVHENTVLCQIHEQLQSSNETDKDVLCTWIESITEKKGEWEGSRNMIDMCEMVKRFYYNPLTKGSNSIKKVLPAILNSSTFIQERYSKPIYGAQFGSKNYENWSWIKKNTQGKVLDPYKLLPPVFTEFDLEELDSVVTENSLADGGAAMTAYARMQFTEMSDLEADRVTRALLKYCELDTFAMVMIYEYWANEIGWLKNKKVA
ncbi:MAG: DUF2779 domain-containing protein [Bdellovibrionota bacterium]